MGSDSRSAVLGLSRAGRPTLVTHSAFQEVLLQATAVCMGTVLLGWMDGWRKGRWMDGMGAWRDGWMEWLGSWLDVSRATVQLLNSLSWRKSWPLPHQQRALAGR